MADQSLKINIGSSFNGEGMSKAQGAISHLSQSAGKAAGAVGRIGSAFGGISGEAGKAIGAVTSLAGALASGGVLGLAVAGVTTAVTSVMGAWQKHNAELEETKKKFKELELERLTKDIKQYGVEIEKTAESLNALTAAQVKFASARQKTLVARASNEAEQMRTGADGKDAESKARANLEAVKIEQNANVDAAKVDITSAERISEVTANNVKDTTKALEQLKNRQSEVYAQYKQLLSVKYDDKKSPVEKIEAQKKAEDFIKDYKDEVKKLEQQLVKSRNANTEATHAVLLAKEQLEKAEDAREQAIKKATEAIEESAAQERNATKKKAAELELAKTKGEIIQSGGQTAINVADSPNDMKGVEAAKGNVEVTKLKAKAAVAPYQAEVESATDKASRKQKKYDEAKSQLADFTENEKRLKDALSKAQKQYENVANQISLADADVQKYEGALSKAQKALDDFHASTKNGLYIRTAVGVAEKELKDANYELKLATQNEANVRAQAANDIEAAEQRLFEEEEKARNEDVKATLNYIAQVKERADLERDSIKFEKKQIELQRELETAMRKLAIAEENYAKRLDAAQVASNAFNAINNGGVYNPNNADASPSAARARRGGKGEKWTTEDNSVFTKPRNQERNYWTSHPEDAAAAGVQAGLSKKDERDYNDMVGKLQRAGAMTPEDIENVLGKSGAERFNELAEKDPEVQKEKAKIAAENARKAKDTAEGKVDKIKTELSNINTTLGNIESKIENLTAK